MKFLELILIIIAIAGMWKVFEKADKPGWYSIIPLFNTYILLTIVNRPWWWLLLFFIPIINIYFAVVVSIDLAKSFGKDWVYGIGLLFLPFVFYPMLGFGQDRYIGPPNRIEQFGE